MIPFLMWLWAKLSGRELRVKEMLLPLSLVGYLILAACWLAYTSIDLEFFEHPNQSAVWVALGVLWVVLAFSLAFGYTLFLPLWRRQPPKAEERDREEHPDE